MRNLRLYPEVKVIGQDFSKEQVMVVPNQSMTLKEILRRFVRRESLPVEKQGVYAEGFGDLEKMAHEDFVERDERIAELKEKVARGKKKKEQESRSEANAEAGKEAESDEAGKAESSKSGGSESGKSPAGSETR